MGAENAKWQAVAHLNLKYKKLESLSITKARSVGLIRFLPFDLNIKEVSCSILKNTKPVFH